MLFILGRFLDACQRIKQWIGYVSSLEQLDGGLRQWNNLYCYNFVDAGKRGDCGASSAVNTTHRPLFWGCMLAQ